MVVRGRGETTVVEEGKDNGCRRERRDNGCRGRGEAIPEAAVSIKSERPHRGKV